MGTLLGDSAAGAAVPYSPEYVLANVPHFAPKAKRIIYMFMSGAPSQMDLFDPKPMLNKMHGQDLPDSVRGNQKPTAMTRDQSSFPCAGSPFKFRQYGERGTWYSDIVPHMACIADDVTVIRSMFTEPINHDPAMTLMQTGFQLAGRPCIGSWMSYGLGSENDDLPAFVVLVSGHFNQPIISRYWHNGFLPSKHQGVQFQPSGDPVLFLSNPAGLDHASRGRTINTINELNRLKQASTFDPETDAKIDSYEMAYRMQTSVPELTDLSQESQATLNLYGANATESGTYAYNALMARRLVERGTRFVQLYHRGWDQHFTLHKDIQRQTTACDQASAALVTDLKQRGLLKDTLVVWGGEFGRTAYSQGPLDLDKFGRDHHPGCFTIWMAGGGVKAGYVHGKTDDFGVRIVEGGVHVHDLHATILAQFGIDHERLTFRFQGRDYRLTDVHGKLVKELLV